MEQYRTISWGNSPLQYEHKPDWAYKGNNTMDVLLIDPPYKSLKGVGIDCGYVVGLVSLAAYLNRTGIESSVLTSDLLLNSGPGDMLNMDAASYARGQEIYESALRDDDHPIWAKISDVIKTTNPKAVGIKYLTPAKCVVEKIASLVKEIDNDTKVIVGGHHPTFCFENVMKNSDIDFAITGEGEIPLAKLSKEIINGTFNWGSVPSLAYREADGSIRKTKNAVLMSDLDVLPFPARDCVLHCDYSVYRTHYMLSARGCPYACAFCSDRQMWQNRVRRRSVSNVIEELRMLKETYDPVFVDFNDGTFTYDLKYLKEFCEGMIAEDLNVMWRCTARYDNVSEEMLKLMKKANCSGLYFGLESGSSRILDSVNKKTTPDQIRTASKMVQDSGIVSMASVLLGLPDEKSEDVARTLKFMKDLACDFFDINCYVPLPGTSLFKLVNDEAFEQIDWAKIGFKSLTTNFSNHIRNDEFKEFILEAYQIAESARQNFMNRLAGLSA